MNGLNTKNVLREKQHPVHMSLGLPDICLSHAAPLPSKFGHPCYIPSHGGGI
jgi:hypothetical protein